MYNGIGLQTARGSGTNGYVQRNLSAVRVHSDRVDYKSEEELKKLEMQFNKKPNLDILEHDRKRQVEVKCMEMQDLMEEQGFTEEEIEAKVSQFRKLLLEKEAVSDNVTVQKDDFGRPVATETHQIALATEEKNARWREAFGIEAREDEKKAFGQEMEKRWEKEEDEVLEKGYDPTKIDEARRKEKKKKHRREPSEEREEKKKHRHRRRSESPQKKEKHSRRSKSPDSPKKDRRRRSRSPQSPPRHRRHEESPKRHRRRSSGSPDGHRSRKKR